MADIKGRKFTLVITWAIATFGCLIITFAFHWSLLLIGMLLIGIGVNPAITVDLSLMS